jgi:hypothetical protein
LFCLLLEIVNPVLALEMVAVVIVFVVVAFLMVVVVVFVVLLSLVELLQNYFVYQSDC